MHTCDQQCMHASRAPPRRSLALIDHERSPWHASAGIGHFNNAFKVAEDIRQLGAVPEEEEAKDPGLDKQMAKAMEDRLLRNIEEDILRGKKDVIRSFMKGDDAPAAAGGTGALRLALDSGRMRGCALRLLCRAACACLCANASLRHTWRAYAQQPLLA